MDTYGEYQFSSLQRELFENKIISIKSDINADMAEYVHNCLLHLRVNDSPDIDVIFRCEGGDVLPGFQIFDELRLYPGNTRGVVMGYSFSMTTIILQACTERIAARNALLLIHNTILSGLSTKILRKPKLNAEAVKFGTITDERVQQILAERTGKSMAAIRRAMDREKSMSAEEAKKFGLIDKII